MAGTGGEAGTGGTAGAGGQTVPAPTGCVKDTDCKDDRICVDGQCQDTDSGCGCRLVAPRSAASPWALAGLLGLSLAVMGRRRRWA